MIVGNHRSLRLVAIIGTFVGAVAGNVRAQTTGPNTWSTVAPLPEGLLWPAVASAAGKLYVFGGLCSSNSNSFCKTFEAYDPHTDTWTSMGPVPDTLRDLPSATTGPDGLIYLYGGTPDMLVYDPQSNAWSHAPSPPGIDGATILVTGRDGRIYAVGGTKNGSISGTVGTLSAYDVGTHAWTKLAPEPTPRSQPGVTVGPDGRIYVIGGDRTAARVEAYNPQTNTWASIASLPTPRFLFQAVTGPDGRIYALGGEGRCFTAPCDEVDAYDVRTKTWTAVAPMPRGRWQFVAATGPDGRIYVLGGFTTTNEVLPAVLPKEVDAYTAIPSDAPLPQPALRPTIATQTLKPMPTARYGLGAATSGGKIYAIGGQADVKPKSNAPTVLRTVEVYDWKTNTWAKGPSLPAPRVGMGVATGQDGRIYVLGGVATGWDQYDTNGYSNITGLRTVFIYNPKTHRWSQGTPMPDGRYALAAVTGEDGRIYTIGGARFCHGDDALATRIMLQVRLARHPAQVMPGPPPQVPGGMCEATDTVHAFNPRTNTWATLAPLPVGGVLPVAAVAHDGRIDVFCCSDSGFPPRSLLEVYDPTTNHWTEFGSLPHVRIFGFAAATSQDGRIDLIGGCLVTNVTQTGFAPYCGDPSPVDAYDPQTNEWRSLGVTLDARQALAATTGPDGHVYAIGGAGYGNGKLLEVIR
jgi:N-acetylneuraminic acid mutarotase